MAVRFEKIVCQKPKNENNIDREYLIVKATFKNNDQMLEKLKNRAWNLAKQVNPHKANDSTNTRDKENLIRDAMGGVLSETAWYHYINLVFGENTVSFTEMTDTSAQIDLMLNNGKTIEIRSSFPRNGVKFALCNEHYNFRNICKYSNLYKPSEIDKDFFGCVLFQTSKANILDPNSDIVLYLIGGSTKEMMRDDEIAYEDNLVAEDDITETKTKYRVIDLKNALDMDGFNQYMIDLGYTPKIKLL